MSGKIGYAHNELPSPSPSSIDIIEKSRLPPPPHAEHGPPVDHKIIQEEVVQAQPQLLWSRIRHTLREPFSEFFGTFILIMFGDGVVAQVVLSKGKNGDYQSITWGWALGVMLGVYTGGISGAHLNPAVTFANCVFRKHRKSSKHHGSLNFANKANSLAQVPRLCSCSGSRSYDCRCRCICQL